MRVIMRTMRRDLRFMINIFIIMLKKRFSREYSKIRNRQKRGLQLLESIMKKRIFFLCLLQLNLFQQILSQYKQMGNESCCERRPETTQNDEVYKLRMPPTKDQQQQYSMENHQLSHSAQQTYKKLMHQHQEDQFLNVQKANHQQGVDRKGSLVKRYQKLKFYEAHYYGQWRDDLPNGQGKAFLPNGSLMVGIFHDGYCNGHSCYQIFNNGSYYSGNINQNIKTGKGKLINSMLQYQGNWHNNLPQGQGMEMFSNGDKYIGHFHSGLKQGKECIFIWKDHHEYFQYKGSFVKGKIEGEGTLTLKHKITIHGKFHENEMDGTIVSDKYKFKGIVKNGRPNDKGQIKILQNNEVYTGFFKDGQLSGECSYKDNRLRHTECFFHKGNKFRKAQGFQNEQIQRILKAIDSCYNSVQKHSQAVQELSNRLPEYQYKYIQPYEDVFGADKYLVLELYDKILFIKENTKQKTIISSKKDLPF